MECANGEVTNVCESFVFRFVKLKDMKQLSYNTRVLFCERLEGESNVLLSFEWNVVVLNIYMESVVDDTKDIDQFDSWKSILYSSIVDTSSFFQHLKNV